MHSHLISRLPGTNEMHYAISHNYTTHANILSCIYLHNLNHTNMLCNFSYITPKISSLVTIHVNSKTLGLLFTTNHQYWFHFVNPNFIAISGLIYITIQFVSQIIHLTPQTVRGQSQTAPNGFHNFHTSVPRFGTNQTATHDLNQLKHHKHT